MRIRPSRFPDQGDVEPEIETDETKPLLPGAPSLQTSYATSLAADARSVTYGAASSASASPSINSTMIGNLPDTEAIKVYSSNTIKCCTVRKESYFVPQEYSTIRIYG